MLTISPYKISFKSNYEREEELRRLRQLEEERKRERERILREAMELAIRKAAEEAAAKKAKEEAARQEEQQRIRTRILEELKQEAMSYPDINNEMNKKMAGFLSQFTCAIQNNSEHDMREFFGDEETAKKLREKLSPECQRDSLELREKIQALEETNDPVMMLITANNMKKFAPKAGILSPEQQSKFVEGLKEVVTMSILKCDMSKFNDDEKTSIMEMVQMIKASDSVDFRISVKLKALVDALNSKKLNIGFIPPVQVKALETMVNRAVL